jgi:hypothetical protein
MQVQQIALNIESLRAELADDPREFEAEMAGVQLFIQGQIKLAFLIAKERQVANEAEAAE